VLITGLLMLNGAHLEGVFLFKVIFALLAIAFNVVCVYAVFKRRQFAMQADIDGMKSTNNAMRIGGLIIPTFLLALLLALYIAW
jgi:uncharacterized membrane protein